MMQQGLQSSAANRARPLAELTAGVVDVPSEIMVTDVTLDSRAVRPGALFLACQGQTRHGIEFAQQAISQGARAVLYDSVPAPGTLPTFDSQIFVAAVPHLSRHVGAIADRFFDAPSQWLSVTGVTGTNGKTTCAYLLAQALTLCGRPAAYIGTIGAGMPGDLKPTNLTTPDAVSVHRALSEMRRLGAAAVGMEVSSHALEQGRVDGVRFRTAAFTNLSHDHLDYHGSMDAYGAAKARLFQRETLAVRVINVDDAFGAQLAAQDAPGRLVVTTRSERPAVADEVLRHAQLVRAARAQAEPTGLEIDIESSWGSAPLSVSLVGDFNIDNVLTVLAVLLSADIPLAEAVNALSRCRAAPGRMETFGGGAQPLAIVDYAHTPDALAKALRVSRAHCEGKLRVVFGCGGDRDASKRPVMGRIAAEEADEVILTDDNPRTEDPARIVADILAGIEERSAVRVEHSRAEAIRCALSASRPGDVVLIAGKGHEDYQIYGTERRPFCDQSIVRAHFGGQG